MTLRMRVQVPLGPPAEYVLDGDEMVIGRAASSAIVIADSRVSRQHARLVRRDDEWWIEDLGARNQTLLNGAPLRQPQALRAGDRLDVGDAVLRLVDGTTAPTAAGAADAARMWTVNEIHRALAAPLSLAELLDLILARCFDVLDPEEGVIMLRGRDGVLLQAASRCRGGGPVTVPRRLVDEVAVKGEPALVLDAAYDERFAGSASMVSSGIRSIVAAPIVDADGTLGLIALCSRVAVRQFVQSDLDMLITIASAAALRVRNTTLAEDLAARRIIEHELELAHDVQMAMLPRTMPSRPGLSIAAMLKPARSVGGDLYDVVLDGDRLWFIVADVAGKSIAAALYMAIARALFRATVPGAGGVDRVAARMNAELARDNERLMFVTAAVGCLDLSNGTLWLVDAGHLPPMIASGGAVFAVTSVPKGLALGVIGTSPYEAVEMQLDPNATLVLCTDGLADARNVEGEAFGDTRLRDAIRAAADRPADALVASVMHAIDAFAAGAPPEDDLTLLALRCGGAIR